MAKVTFYDHASIRALMRGFRTAVAVAISGFIATLLKDPAWLWLTPVLMVIDKYVRDHFQK